MPNSERIETLISPEALKQFETLKPIVDANTASFEKLIAKAVELNKAVGNASTFKEINKATKELEDNDQELINAQSELLKSQERLKKANKDLGDSFANVGTKIAGITGSTEDAFEKLIKLSDALKGVKNAQKELAAQKDTFAQMNQSLPEVQQGLAEILKREKELKAEEAILKKSITDTNKEIKQRLNTSLVTPGTRDEIKQTIIELKNLRDFKIDINTDEGKAQIAEINQEIDRLNKVLEQTTDKLEKRKINIGNYPGAIKILQSSLQDVNKKIDDFTKSGNDNQQMLQALVKEQDLLQRLVDTQTEGFKSATAAIKGNEQAIQALSQVYGEDSEVVQNLINETGRLKDEVGDLRARIKVQASDTKVFDGLIDAAQGLAGIYSVAQGAAALFGDENEELQKTFVKLQAVMAVLQGLQAIQNVLQKESAARQLLNIGLQKVTVLQTNLETAAQSKNIVVKYAAIAAQKALNAAMSLAGGPLLAVVGLLALLLISLSSFASATTKAKRNFEALNEEFAGFEALLNEEVDAIKRAGDETVAELESQFASEAKIREARRKTLKEESAAIRRFLADNGAAYKEAFRDFENLTNRQRAGEKLSEEEEKRLRQVEAFVQKFQAARNRDFAIDSQIEIDRLNNIKSTKEEAVKAQQEEIEATKLQLQTRQQLQQSIAGDERKTQKERIEALKESARIQRQLINSDADSKRLTPGLTPSEIKVIEAQRTAALTQARRESNKAIEDLNRSYAERERKARFDIVKTEIEDQIKAADLIANNEAKSFNDRTDALYASYEKRRQLITANYEYELQQAIKNGAIAEERIALEEKALSEINQLTVDYGLQQQAIYQDNTGKVNVIIEKGLQRRKDIISSNESDAIVALNEQLQAGLITTEEYSRQRGKIEKSARIQQIKEEINDLTGKKITLISQKKQQSNEFISLEEAEKKKRKELSDELTDEVIANEQRMTDLKKQLASEYFETFNSFATAQFENEIARIQEQMAEVDRQKDHDIAAANATIANKQERETAIAKIEVRAQAERERLERRQRQIELERARFEKASNIAQIIGNTAVAIMNQLKVTPLPAGAPFITAIGAIGALQLARAIAAPLPKFAEGTTDAPGGLAWVGDGYKKELVITPQGQVMQTPAVPTVMNVPRHSIVLPDARAALESGLAVNKHGRLVQNDQGDIKEVGRKIDTLTKVVRNKPTLNMSADQGGLTAMWQYGANWVMYAEDQTRF